MVTLVKKFIKMKFHKLDLLKFYNEKIDKKTVTIVSMCALFTFLFIFPQNGYCDLTKILTDAITSAIAFLIRTIADGMAKILTDMGLSLQKLVFNIQDGGFNGTSILDDNLSLLKGTVLSNSLFQLYDLFVYIAEAFLGTVTLFITFDFLKAANNAAHKTKLKERLIKLVVAMILLLSLPTLFDILMIFNQTFIDIFKAFISDIVSPGDVSGGYLTDVFKTLAESDTTSIVYALIYLISSFLNIWLAIYYMIRDITISFLFILAPIIIILLPYRTDLMIKWFKEMCSNIFTQAIQALVFTVIIAITKSLGSGNATLYDKIFALVSFAMFIPITGIIKKMLDLEGDIGAAKSSAGLGGAIGAIGLGSAVAAGVKANFAKNKGLVGDIGNIAGEEKLLKKGKFGENTDSVKAAPQSNSIGNTAMQVNKSGTAGGGRTVGINPNNKIGSNKNYGVTTNSQDYDNNGGYTATNRVRQLKGMKRQAQKQLAKNVAGGLGTGIVGGSMALAGSSFGVGGALMGGRLGSELGEIGGNVAEGVSSIKNTVSEKTQDAIFGTGVRYDGEDNPALNSLFKDTVVPRSVDDVKDNFNKIKDNFNENKAIISINKDLSKINPSGVTGLDKTGMSEQDVNTENKALLKRNRMEREGRFQQSHRSYAKNTYDRNDWGKEPSNEDVSKATSPVNPIIGSDIPGSADSKGISLNSPKQTPSEIGKKYSNEINQLKNISKKANNNVLIDSGIMQSTVSSVENIPQSTGSGVPDIHIPKGQQIEATQDMSFSASSIDRPKGSNINTPNIEVPQNIDYGVQNIDVPTSMSIPMDIPQIDNSDLPSIEVPQNIEYGIVNTEIPTNIDMPVDTPQINYSDVPNIEVPQNINYGVQNNNVYKQKRNNAKRNQQINLLGSNIKNNTDEYLNNAEYLLALRSCKNDIANIHQGSDNGQLS